MKFDSRSKLFLFLAGLFVTSLVVGDLVGNKLLRVNLFGWVLAMPAGMLAFPVTFLLTDVVNDFYGRKAARYLTLVGFGMAVYTLIIINVAVWLPRHEWTSAGYEDAYRTIFLSSRRILLASMCAYLVGQFLDIAVFHFFKKRTGNRMIWLRATGSTLISQLVDTFVVQFLAFYATLKSNVFKVVITAYVLKFIIAILLTPVIYAWHGVMVRWLGLRPVVIGEEED